LKILEQAVEKFRDGEEFAMITVVNTSGSIPAKIGARMIVNADATEGTIGGGALENSAITRARTLLSKKGKGCLVRIKSNELNMNCGGEVTLFFESFYPRPGLWIFGGGHIALELVPLANSIGFSVTVVDIRPDFANKNRFPNAFPIIPASYAEAAGKVPADSFVVILTHKHLNDEEVLLEVAGLKPPLPYIGMIGSARKVQLACEKLRAAGYEPGKNIYSPIGLDIGGGDPAEIAVSIASELLGVLHKKSGLPHCRNKL